MVSNMQMHINQPTRSVAMFLIALASATDLYFNHYRVLMYKEILWKER
jgi:hypothetical protein